MGSQVVFELSLAQAEEWTCCIHAEVESMGSNNSVRGRSARSGAAEVPETGADAAVRAHSATAVRPWLRRLSRALRCRNGETPYVAAGVPWFMCLFGRDTLVSALMAGLLGALVGSGALAALAPLQATERDDWRDAEPGKLPHELRRGELAFRHLIPHTPYYGTHDAPALYCLALWNAWRWTGDDALLDAHLETAQRAPCSGATNWATETATGLQEYATRSQRRLLQPELEGRRRRDP